MISERDILGTQLVRRNDELALLYEKIKIQHSTLGKGELQYRQRLEDIRLLKLEIKKLRREKNILNKNVANVDDLRYDIRSFLGRPQGMTLLGRPQGMTLCLHDRVSVCVSVCLSVRQHFGIHFFIGLYLFNTTTDQVHFCHACTLGPGLYSPNVFGDAASLIMLIYAKSVSPSTFWYTLFYILVCTLFYRFISF